MAQISYFAYGSNLLAARLQERCSSARFVTTAVLLGYNLSFGKKSKDGSGKATIIASDQPKSKVYGAVFEITPNDLKSLDIIEGRKHGYDRVEVEVLTLLGGKAIRAITYMAEQEAIDLTLQPYDWYLALVQKGAEQLGLPQDYRTKLRSIQSVADANPQRKERLAAIAILMPSEC